MLKRLISLLLCATMVFSVLPLQAFAEESIGETEAVTETTAAETTEVTETTEVPETTEVTETAQTTEPAQTEPVVTEPVATEPAATEPAVTEPEETEPEETEETEPEQKDLGELLIPEERIRTVKEKTLRKSEDVRVFQEREDGTFTYYDTTETAEKTVTVVEETTVSPRRGYNLMSVGEDDLGHTTFETFADLQKLASQPYSEWTEVYYVGEGQLVISEDITLPENFHVYFYDGNSDVKVNAGVTFTTVEYFNVETLTIDGTYNCYGGDVGKKLTVNGSLVLYSDLCLKQNTTVTGIKNVTYAEDWASLWRSCGVYDPAGLAAVANAAASDLPGITYYIHVNMYGGYDADGNYVEGSDEFVLNQSVTIPSTVESFNVWGPSQTPETFVIGKGCTLELNCGWGSFHAPVVVEGTLKNNADSNISVDQTMTFAGTGSYRGSGVLTVQQDTENGIDSWDDLIIGLNTDTVFVDEWEYGNGNTEWEIIDTTGKKQLGTPTEVQWGKEYTWALNEQTGNWEVGLRDHAGCMTWRRAEPDQGEARVKIYDEEGTLVNSGWCVFGSTYKPEYRSIDNFIMMDPESGTYYFTVQSRADNTGYYSSNVAESGTFKYTKPNKQLGSCSNMTWNWPYLNWTAPAGAAEGTTYDVEYYYSETPDGEKQWVGGSWGMSGCEDWIYDEVIADNGSGYYYFRVRAITHDITKVCNGPWSDYSEAFNLNEQVQNVKQDLDNISTKAGEEEIRQSVQDLDTDALKGAMLADKGSDGVIDQLTELENAVGGAAPVTVRDEVAIDGNKVSVVGANLNDAAAESTDPIALVLDKPEKDHVLDAAYDNSVAVSFSMTLDNVEDAENLAVPVKVTIPVPDGVNPNFLVILHYKQNGEIEELMDGIGAHVYKEGGQWYASFVLTSFSDFAITQFAEKTEDNGGLTTGVTWEFTSHNALKISGNGDMDDYALDALESIPWYEHRNDITDIEIGEGVTHIGAYAFAGCGKVTEITIPAGVATLGERPFYGMSGLEAIDVAEENEAFDSVNGVLYSADGEKLVAYPSARYAGYYSVPYGVKAIGAYALYDNRYLYELDLPENLTAIEKGAFENCWNLATICIPDSVKEIQSNAFKDCTALTWLEFLGEPPVIAEDAFAGAVATIHYPALSEAWAKIAGSSYGGDLTWVPSKYVEVISATGENKVLAGKTLNLTAGIMPDGSGETFYWSLDDGDELRATLKARGNTATLTAADVSELCTVTVTVETSNPDIAPCVFDVEIIPKAKKLQVFAQFEEEEEPEQLFENQTYYFDSTGLIEGAHLFAQALPTGADSTVTWTSSNPKVLAIDKESGALTFTGVLGTVKITATAADGSGTKAVFNCKVVNPVLLDPVGDTEIHIAGGQSVTLSLMDLMTGKPAKSVDWLLSSEPFEGAEESPDAFDATAVATISNSGKVTAKKVVAETTVYAYAYGVVEKQARTSRVVYTIHIHPAATQLEVYAYEETVNLNGKTVAFDLGSDEEKTLTAVLFPDDAMDDVDWTISDRKNAFADYEINGSTVTVKNPTRKAGTVTFTATAKDGSKKRAVVKMQFATLVQEVVMLSESDAAVVSGKSLQLTAKALAANGMTPTNSKLVWTIVEGSEYAKINASGRLTAGKVYENTTVTVRAAAQDGSGMFAEAEVTILPQDDSILVLRDKDGKNVTNSTIYADFNVRPTELQLYAGNVNPEESVSVTWDWSNKNVLDVIGGWVNVKREGSCTITATARDGSGRTAKVTVKTTRLAEDVTITAKPAKDVIIAEDGSITLASGKSVNLQAAVSNATNKKVIWEITEGADYAAITSSGKLTTAKDLTTTRTIRVKASAADGGGAFDTVEITVKPLATGLQVFSVDNDGAMVFSEDTESANKTFFGIIRTYTTFRWNMGDEETLQMNSLVYPYYEGSPDRSAAQDVIWTSSNAKVASIDQKGLITCHRAGTVTITCAAADGSGQKVTFKLEVVKLIENFSVASGAVVGGKSLDLNKLVTFYPEDATNKKLYWELYDDGTDDSVAFATVTSAGRLTAKKVTSPKTVRVVAWPDDGSECYGECRVRIYPKAAKGVEIWLKNGDDRTEVTKKTITASVGDELSLRGEVIPYDEATCRDCTWKSSAPDYVAVDEYGEVTALKKGKTVTITCTAADGSGKNAIVKISVK